MRKNFFSKILIASVFLSLGAGASMPLIASAQTSQLGSGAPSASNFQIVPCNAPAGYSTDPITGTNVNSAGQPVTPCDFAHLMILVQNIINLLIYAAGFIAVLSIVYAGFLYLTAGGDTGKVKQAHEIFKVTFIGFAIALCSWLVVYTVIQAVISPNFNFPSFLQKQ